MESSRRPGIVQSTAQTLAPAILRNWEISLCRWFEPIEISF